MKKLISTLAALLMILVSFAQDKVMKEMDAVKIAKTDVPGPLVQKAEKDFPNASPFQYYAVGDTVLSKDWKVTETTDIRPGDQINYYKVDMKGKDSNFEALYDQSGKLIMSKEVQRDVALPKAVLASYEKSEYKKFGLKKDMHYKMTNHGNKKEYYVVTLGNGKKLTYAPDGTLMKKK